MISDAAFFRAVALLSVVALAGCQGLRVPNASLLDAGAWPVSGGSSARANAADARLSVPLELAWTYNAEAGFGPASPMVAGEYVFVATRKGDVHAIRFADGKRIGYVSVGSSVEGAALVDADAFFGASASGRRPVFRYDLKAGRMAWRAPFEAVLAGVLRDGDRVVAGDAAGNVAAFSALSGEEHWRVAAAGGVGFRAAPVATASGIFVVDDRGRQRLIRRSDGAVRWERQGDPVYSTPAARGDTLFVASTRGGIEAVRASDGEPLWHVALPDTSIRLAAPALLGADLAVAGTDGTIRLLSVASGAARWETTIDGAITAAPLLTRDHVIVGTMNRKLLALARADGAVVWEYELRGRMKSAMAVAEGSLVVLSEPRHVYRFDPVVP